MAEKTLEYRIPSPPIGQAYYRQGRRYEPGEKVRIPADEIPGGWVRDPDTGKAVPFLKSPKTGKITKRRNPAAWKLLTPGVREADEEKLSAVELKRREIQAARDQLEEAERVLSELESDAGPEPEPEEGIEVPTSRGIVDVDGDGEGEELEEGGEDAPDGEAKGKSKGKGGKKRAADAEL